MPSSRLARELDGTGLRSFSAPALPADREADALQRRAERAGACDGPLWARPALSVAIPLVNRGNREPLRERTLFLFAF